MIYFRKIWIPILSLCATIYILVKYLPKIFNYIVVTLANNHFPTSLENTLARWSYKFENAAIPFQTHIRNILIFIIIFLVLWFALNGFTGQLNRDIKSIFIKKHLINQAYSDILGSSIQQEKISNSWIKKLRVIKYKKKIYLIIPSGINYATLKIIKSRCDIFLLPMLNQTFKQIDWVQEVEIKSLYSILFLIVKSK